MKAKGSGNSYSWWWDSHNTPKNSKWLEDNLNDMDSKVKAMLKLIEEDADSFAKRAEMYYNKRPDLVSLVEDFYRAYRALAERYDQLTGHICQIPQELQAQFGFPSDSSPGSPVSGNFGNVRRKAAGIGVFKSPRTPTRSQESYEKVNDRQDQSGTGDDDLSSSSSSDSESADSKARKKQLDEIQRLKEENELLRRDLDKSVAEQVALEQRLAYLEEELKALHEAYSAQSKTAALKGEVEGLKKANAALGVEVASGVQQVEELKKELDLSQQEQSRLSIRLEESGLRERELKAKMNELEAKIQQLTEELLYSAVVRGQLEKELTALRDEKSKPSDEVSVRESRIGELEEEIRRLQEALAMSESGKNKIFDLQQSLEKNSSDLHIQFTLQEEKRKLSEELVAVSQQVQSLEQQLRQAQEALESSESAKNKVDGLLIEMEKSLSDLQREFTSMQERLNGQLSLQAKEMQILEEQVERLQAALASLHGEKSRGLEFQDVLEKRLLELQQELLQAKQEANKVADEVANKAELVQRLEGEIETRDETIGSLQGEISVKQEEGSALRNQLEDSSKELQRFQSDVRKLQALLGDSQGQTKTLVQQLKEVQQELGQARAEASNLGDQLADRVSFIGRLEVEAENREKLVSNLRDEISAKLDEGHILREQLEAGAGEGKRLETEVQKLQDLLNGSQNENKELSCEMQRIFESSSKLSEERNELHRLVDTLKKELDASKQKLDHEVEILMGEKAGLTEERVQNLDEIAKLGNRLQETLIKLEEREGYILNLEQELKRLTEDLSDSHQEGASHLEKYQTLKGDKEGLDIELALLQEANSKLQSEIASRIEQAQQLELTFKKLEDVSVMPEANAKLTSDLEMVVTQARTAEEKCLLQEQESSDLQEEKAKLAAEVGEQQASWNLDRTRLREGINQLTEEKREFQKTLLMWTEQREKLEMEHTALKSKSRDVEDSLLCHQTEHSRVLSELSEKSERVQMLDGELRKMQRELTGSQDDTRRLSTELQKTTEELKEQLKAENEKVQLLRDDVYNLQQALLSAQEERQICQEHMKEFKIKEESMESQILKLKGEVLSLNEHCKEFLRRHDDKIKQKEALEVDKQELQKALVRAQQEKESAKADCDFLVKELTRERDNRSRAEETHAKLQIEIEGLVAEIARLQAELQGLQRENENLTVRSEAALEQERKDAIEIDTLLKALQSVHVENGSFIIEERSWHLEAKHPTLRHLKESMLKLLTDRSKIKQEAVAHADRVKQLNLEIEKAGQMLEVSKGEYYSLTGKHEIVLKELQTLEVQVSQLEKQILFLEEEKRKLHDQLLSSLRDSDEVSAEFLREKKELYEKLVVEGEHVLKLQEEIKMTREENIEHRSSIDDTHRQIQKLLLDIQELGRDSASKEEREKSLNQQIQKYAEEYAKVEQSLNEALSALSLEKTEVISLRDEASFKNQQLWRLEEEIALLKHKLGEREQEILVLQQHRESLEGQLETELAHIRKLEAESSLWQEKNTSLISSLSFNEKKAMELLEQHGLLTKEKEEVSAELQNKVLSADIQRQENRKLYQQLENSELRIDSLVEHSAAISQKYDAAASELEKLQLQLSSLLEENGRLGKDVLSRTVSLAELTEVVSSVEKRNADLEAEANAKQENRIMMEEQMAALQQENDQLKQALKSGTEDMRVLNEEISKLRQHQLKLQNEHDFLVHEKERSLDEHSLILSRLEKVQRDLSFQQGENSRLDTEALNASTRIQELVDIISELEKEKQAFSVELASTSLLMNEMHRRADSLQDEVGQLRNQLKLGNEQLQQKNEEIQDLLSMSKDLREERIALSLEVEKKIQDYCSLEATLCSLQEEYLSLVNKNSLLSEEVASGDNLVVKLKDDIVQLRAEKEAQDQMIILRTADVQRLQEDLSLVQDSEEKLGKLLDLKEQAVHQLEEEIERLKAALYGVQEEYKQEKGNLEIELKKIQLVVLDNEERMRTLQERISSKQREIDHVQSTNENSKNSMRKLEGELESLKEQLGIFQMKNSLLNDEVSIKASLIQDLDQSFTSLKEEKVVFEGGVALAIGNVGLVQAEVDKLLEKISKLGELSRATGEKLQKVEDKFCKLQVSNLNMRDELSGSAKKEKSYVIAVRFMRAEFFCLVQRIKSLEEEKADLARQAELAMDAERKKSGEVLSSLHQELAFLKEENKTLRSIIFDRAEEKREAIRQLCLTLDYMQEKNRRLEGVINSVRDKIQRRISVAGARRN